MRSHSIFSGLRSMMALLVEQYNAYPVVTGPVETCAYYKAQNKRFRIFFLGFSLGMVFVDAISDVALIAEGKFHYLLYVLLHQATLGSVLILLSVYVFRTGQQVITAKKGDLEAQARIRRRFMVCGFAPTCLFVVTPLASLAAAEARQAEICYMLFSILQVQLAAWNIGSISYKFFIVATFSFGYNYIAFSTGAFNEFVVQRLVLPIALSATSIVLLDKYIKENFLLKRALRNQRDMYQQFFQQIQDPVLIFSPAGLLFQNSAAEAQLGTTHSRYYDRLRNFVGSRGWSLEDHVRSLLEDDSGTGSTHGTMHQERFEWIGGDVWVSDGKKARRTVKVTLIESPDLCGSIETARQGGKEGTSCKPKKYVTLVVHDITEELQREEKRAEDKYKNMLLFSLSHELKTPLNIFQRFLSESKKLISAGPASHDLYLEAKGAWRYLRNKINDILDYAQILSGEFSLHLCSFSTERLVRYLHKVTSFLLTAKQRAVVTLDFRIDRTVPDPMYADRDRLEQVLFNLLSNAAKFTESGRIELSIAPVEGARRGELCIEFSVHDTGCGMPEEKVMRLFALSRDDTPVAKLDHRDRKATQLSGLGLTVSRMICAQMGCEIAVRSTLGKGSTFSFKIPLSTASRASISAAKATSTRQFPRDQDTEVAQEGHCLVPRSKLTVRRGVMSRLATQGNCSDDAKIALVVDDNDFNRYVAERMLTKMGFRTVTAGNGKLAVDTLANMQQENVGVRVLVFMDVDMPIMDGIEATVRIRKENSRPRPVIVALTAFSAESERRKCFEAGMDAFVDKPLTKERLYEVLCNVGAL